mmetsp:Transcript_6890/g.14862  ORF Transcript_6890/g.14862 Transcript_6890/m.14862 type:complete len:215 (-) Transcript_6890:659-1303(-)
MSSQPQSVGGHDVFGKNRGQGVLQRIDAGRRQRGDQDEHQNVPPLRQTRQNVKEGEIGEFFVAVVGGFVIGIGQHRHETKEEHEEEHHSRPQRESLSHGGDGVGRPDPLPSSLVEHLRTGDGDEEGHGGSEPVHGPVGSLGVLRFGEVAVFFVGADGHRDQDHQHGHDDGLEFIRDDARGKSGDGGVEDGDHHHAEDDVDGIPGVLRARVVSSY